VSIRTRLKRLEAQVDWLDENGELLMLEMQWKLIQLKEQIYARDPALSRRLGLIPPDKQKLEEQRAMAPPSLAPPQPAQPHPEERPARPRLEGSEPAPRSEPILRDASLRSAPQDEEVRVEPPPEPERVQPFTYDPPPEMQIRPVTWRRRGPQDYEDDEDDMYGKCIVDYDPLGYLDTDDD